MRRCIVYGILAILITGITQLALPARAENVVDKNALRYDGKPFEYWRTYMRTELKAE